MFSSQNIRRCSRRSFVAGLGSAAALACGVGGVRAAEPEVNRTVVVPNVPEFEDNYVGQFLTILGRTEGTPDPDEDLAGCTDLPWPRDRTQQDRGQLTDRRSDRPVAVRVPVYLDAEKPDLAQDALFIIDGARSCGIDHVILDLVSVDLRSLVGKAPGPTVDEDDPAGEATGDAGPGFGALAGVLGVGGALALRALSGRRGSE